MAKDNQPTVEELQAQIEAERAEKQRLQTALDEANTTGIVSPPVAGVFSVTGENPNTGKSETKKFRFKNGRIRTPLPSGQQVSSANLIQLANGAKHDDIKSELPWFAELTQEDAQQVLRRLVDINASTIEPVTKAK